MDIQDLKQIVDNIFKNKVNILLNKVEASNINKNEKSIFFDLKEIKDYLNSILIIPIDYKIELRNEYINSLTEVTPFQTIYLRIGNDDIIKAKDYFIKIINEHKKTNYYVYNLGYWILSYRCNKTKGFYLNSLNLIKELAKIDYVELKESTLTLNNISKSSFLIGGIV